MAHATEPPKSGTINPVLRALRRARIPSLTVFLAHALAVGVGIAFVQTGNPVALGQRDTLVGSALASDPASIALEHGHRLEAALIDFSRNLLLGGVPATVGGLAIVIPYGLAAYRGWVGGIVSVDSTHASRLTHPAEAVYYLVTLILQIIPYALAGGAGVQLGLAYLRTRPEYEGARWLGLPVAAVRDVGWIYLLVVPLILIASLWEFLLVP